MLALAPKPVVLEAGGKAFQSVWPVRVIQTSLLVQYFTAGWCKIFNGDWLQEPYAVWTQSQGVYMTDLC